MVAEVSEVGEKVEIFSSGFEVFWQEDSRIGKASIAIHIIYFFIDKSPNNK